LVRVISLRKKEIPLARPLPHSEGGNMMRMLTKHHLVNLPGRFLALWLLFTALSPAAGQSPAEAVTTDAKIAPEELAIRLRPMMRDEVGTELKAWLSIVQTEAQKVADLQLKINAANGNEVATLSDELVGQRSVLARVSSLTKTVVADFEAKGGDGAEATDYLSRAQALPAPSGIKAMTITAKAWLFSRDGGGKFVLSLAAFVGCLMAAWLVGAIIAKILKTALNRVGRVSNLLRNFLIKSVKRAALLIGFVIGISYLGVNIGPLLAAIGAAGLVIGLALQGTLSNFASGIMILLYRPFDVGDVISAGGITGKVESMTLVSTVFLTADNQRVVVPNNQIWDGVITNITAHETRRVDLVFGIGYDDDIEKALTVLREVVTGHELVLADPDPVIRVNELADSSVNFVVRPWAKTSDYWEVYWGLTQQVKERFDKERISIPFPQRDVHLINAPNEAAAE